MQKGRGKARRWEEKMEGFDAVFENPPEDYREEAASARDLSGRTYAV